MAKLWIEFQGCGQDCEMRLIVMLGFEPNIFLSNYLVGFGVAMQGPCNASFVPPNKAYKS